MLSEISVKQQVCDTHTHKGSRQHGYRCWEKVSIWLQILDWILRRCWKGIMRLMAIIYKCYMKAGECGRSHTDLFTHRDRRFCIN